MQNVQNVNTLKTIGEPLSFIIEKGVPFTITSVLPANYVVELSEVHVGGDEGVVFPAGRRFVPSFDESLADKALILSWSNKEEQDDGQDRVVVTGAFVKDEQPLVTFDGSGFERVVMVITEYEVEATGADAVAQQSLTCVANNRY